MNHLTSLAGQLLLRYKGPLVEYGKFLIVGGVSFLLHLFLTTVLVEFGGFAESFAHVIAAMTLLPFMFFAYNRNVFVSDIPRAQLIERFAAFLGGYIGLYLFNLGIFLILISVGVYYPIALTFATGVVSICTFFFLKKQVFHEDTHGLAFLVATFSCLLLVIFLNNLPHIVRQYELGVNYQPLSLAGDFDGTNVVGARLREVLDGNIWVGDTDVYEYRDGPVIQSPGAPFLYVFVAPFVSTIKGLLIGGDVVYSGLLFFLFLLLCLEITSGRRWLSLWFATTMSTVVAFGILIPPQSIDGFFGLLNVINPFTENVSVFGSLLRHESFIPGLVPFVAGLLFLFRSVRMRSYLYAVLMGLCAAGTVYVYPFHALYLASTLVLLGFWWIISRDWQLVRLWVVAAVCSILLLIPFLYNQHQLSLLPHSGEFLSRFGVEVGRVFASWHAARYVWALVCAAIALLLSKKEDIFGGYIIVALMCSVVVVFNMQLILGFNVQPDHWLNRTLVWGFDCAYLFILYLFSTRLPTSLRKMFGAMGVLLLCFSLVNVGRFQIASAKSEALLFTLDSKYSMAFEWLNDFTEKDSVVVTPSLVSNILIPTHTHNRIFVPRMLGTLASEQEIISRLFAAHRLFDVSYDDLGNILENDIDYRVSADDPLQYYDYAGVRYLFSLSHTTMNPQTYVRGQDRFEIPDALRNTILEQYDDVRCVGIDCLFGFAADYVFVGPRERVVSRYDFDTDPLFTLVYYQDNIAIYAINR